MDKLLSSTNGYKTYLTVFVGIGLGIAQALGYDIPVWVDPIIGFLGLGALRLAVQKQSAQAATDITGLLQTILNAVEVMPPVTPVPVPVPTVSAK